MKPRDLLFFILTNPGNRRFCYNSMRHLRGNMNRNNLHSLTQRYSFSCSSHEVEIAWRAATRETATARLLGRVELAAWTAWPLGLLLHTGFTGKPSAIGALFFLSVGPIVTTHLGQYVQQRVVERANRRFRQQFDAAGICRVDGPEDPKTFGRADGLLQTSIREKQRGQARARELNERGRNGSAVSLG